MNFSLEDAGRSASRFVQKVRGKPSALKPENPLVLDDGYTDTVVGTDSIDQHTLRLVLCATEHGQRREVIVKAEETVAALKDRLYQEGSSVHSHGLARGAFPVPPPAHLTLLWSDMPIRDDMTLAEAGVTNGGEIEAVYCPVRVAVELGEVVEWPSGEEATHAYAWGEETLEEVLRRLEREHVPWPAPLLSVARGDLIEGCTDHEQYVGAGSPHRWVHHQLDQTMSVQLATAAGASLRLWKQPVKLKVVLCGAPGVGKSSLLRALIGLPMPESSLIRALAGREGDSTTLAERHSAEWEHQGRSVQLAIEEVETCSTAAPEALDTASDTAPLGAEGGAPRELTADVVILAYSKISKRSLQSVEVEWLPHMTARGAQGQCRILVQCKADLQQDLDPADELRVREAVAPCCFVRTSIKTGEGVLALQQCLKKIALLQ